MTRILLFQGPIICIPQSATSVAFRNPANTPTMIPVDHIIAQKTEGALGVTPVSSSRANSMVRRECTMIKTIAEKMQNPFWSSILKFHRAKRFVIRMRSLGASMQNPSVRKKTMLSRNTVEMSSRKPSKVSRSRGLWEAILAGSI
jgi:hypothetical protein